MKMRYCFLILSLTLATSAFAASEDFSGQPAGTVVAGDLPGGGTSPGTVFPGFTLSVSNNNGPNSLLIFDSANPTGGDLDLGSPNNTCGGPGVGTGGEVGMPGENCVGVGNILVIAEDIVDTSPNDGLVDDPDDEADGGIVTLTFDEPVVIFSMVIIDIDNETLDFTLLENGMLKGTLAASDLGDNSVQDLDLSSYGAVTDVELDFSSSGSLAELEWLPAAVATESTSFGRLKAKF